jgi:hypothetical protein
MGGMPESNEPTHAVRDALFLDIPYIIDSICRHADYRLNRLHRFTVGSAPQPRSYTALPAFFFFVLVLLFSVYGATLGSLCGLLGARNIEAGRHGAGVLCELMAIGQWVGTVYLIAPRIEKRFRKQNVTGVWRRAIVALVLMVLLAAWAAPLFYFGYSLLDATAFEACRPDTPVRPAWIQLLVFLAAVACGAAATRVITGTRGRVLSQTAILAAAALILWNLPGAAAGTEAAQVPYRHLYTVIAAGCALIACVATWLVSIPFASIKETERAALQQALTDREIFPASRHDPELTPRRIYGGCFVGVLRTPLQFLLLPAFAIILVPTEYIWLAWGAGTLAAALLIIAGNLTSRWDQMSQYLRRYFLLGTPFVVSLAVIIIAALRIANVQYVATVVNVAPFGVLFAWMIMAYVLGWWFEYQVNSVLAAKLLWVLGADGTSDERVVPCDLGKAFSGQATRVECKNRHLAAHATGQMVAFGETLENETGKMIVAFNTYAFLEFFGILLADRDTDASHELARRVQSYFALVNTLLVAAFGLLYWHLESGDRNNTVAPVVVAEHESTNHTADLAALLHAESAGSPPALVVAASGGGTRAALYAANVLQGLHRLHADGNVVLLSGVSGGGVASAYFYGHRDALVSGDRQPCDALNPTGLEDPWTCYLNRMSMPFIRDVLQGAGEWRIQSDVPLGKLLAESFERRLFADGQQTLGADPRLGLILNTTVAGHPLQDSAMTESLIRLPSGSPDPCVAYERPVSAFGGGRLAFSNLADISTFSKSSGEITNIQMPFTVVRDPAVPLASAAALNANFPPVFPNARVDLTGYGPDASGCTKRSYFVTDGGATENLGLVSALLALQSALQDRALKPPLRDIDIVLAEASAADYDYSQDRGIGASTDQSKERLTGRLTLELLDEVRAQARAVDPAMQIRLHDLSLPLAFRSRGGFGTHWMFPGSINVTNPLQTPLPRLWMRKVADYSGLERYSVTLDKEQLMALWDALYDAKWNSQSDAHNSFCAKQWPDEPHAAARTVARWICGKDGGGTPVAAPDRQLEAWERLTRLLSPTR